MAIRFREITEKAEKLLEQGQDADEAVHLHETMVTSAHARVQAAQRAVTVAAETRSEDDQSGDILEARIQLRMAQGQMAAGQRALDAARQVAERVQNDKKSHVRVIEQHNRVARENMRKVQLLAGEAFGSDVAALAQGIAERNNLAGEARARLLRSMGIVAGVDAMHAPDPGKAEAYAGRGGRSSAAGVTDARLHPAAGNQEHEQKQAYANYLQQFRELMLRHANDPAARAVAAAALGQQYAQLARRRGWIAANSQGRHLLGVLIPNDFPLTHQYEEQLMSRAEAARPEVRRVFAAMNDRLEVCDSRLDHGTAQHYSPQNGFYVYADGRQADAEIRYEKRGVHYSAAADEQDKRGPGTVFFHEIGHMIDHAANGFSEVCLSDDLSFLKALADDKRIFLSAYNDLNDTEQKAFIQWLGDEDHTKHSVSDILGGLTGNDIAGRWTHDTAYWQKGGNPVASEAFAHFFEASMGGPGRKNEWLGHFFPNACARFQDLIESVDVSDMQDNVLAKTWRRS